MTQIEKEPLANLVTEECQGLFLFDFIYLTGSISTISDIKMVLGIR